jgi:hypothetical protein
MNDENARPAAMKATTTAVRALSSWAVGSGLAVVVTSAPVGASNRFDRLHRTRSQQRAQPA